MAVANRMDSVQAHEALLTILAAFYFVGAFTLVFAPDNQLFAQGTRPVFALLPPLAWAAWFLVACVATTVLAIRVTGPRQFVAWSVVIPSQTVWNGAGLIAVLLQDSGSAMAVVFTVTVLAYTLVTVWLTWRAYTSGKR